MPWAGEGLAHQRFRFGVQAPQVGRGEALHDVESLGRRAKENGKGDG